MPHHVVGLDWTAYVLFATLLAVLTYLSIFGVIVVAHVSSPWLISGTAVASAGLAYLALRTYTAAWVTKPRRHLSGIRRSSFSSD